MTFWDWLSASWQGTVEYVKHGSTHVMNICRAILYALMLFNVWNLTTEQMLALLAIVESVLQGISAKTTVSAVKVSKRVEEAHEKGIAVGVASTGSGTGSGWPR